MDDSSLIERYQLLYQQDPKSKVFATLAEAYRKMGLLKEARRVCEDGLTHNPQFASGRVALARVFMDLGDHRQAIVQLEKAIGLSPENILAHSLLAECQLQLKNPKEALRAFKMVLFFSPDNSKAQKAVRKLESLTADEYDDDLFAMRPLKEAVATKVELEEEQKVAGDDKNQSILERYLSLADAFLVRNDIERAQEALVEVERLLGPHKEIERRLKLIQSRSEEEAPTEVIHRKQLYRQEKIEYLKLLLSRISERRAQKP